MQKYPKKITNLAKDETFSKISALKFVPFDFEQGICGGFESGMVYISGILDFPSEFSNFLILFRKLRLKPRLIVRKLSHHWVYVSMLLSLIIVVNGTLQTFSDRGVQALTDIMGNQGKIAKKQSGKMYVFRHFSVLSFIFEKEFLL